jgi:hypothetical protein
MEELRDGVFWGLKHSALSLTASNGACHAVWDVPPAISSDLGSYASSHGACNLENDMTRLLKMFGWVG